MLMDLLRTLLRERQRLARLLALLLAMLPGLSGGLGVPRNSPAGGSVSDPYRIIRLATGVEESEELLHAKPRKLTRRAMRRRSLARSFLCRSPRTVYAVAASTVVRPTYPDDEPYTPLRDPHLPPPVWRGPPTA
jgi:hypothetical protein